MDYTHTQQDRSQEQAPLEAQHPAHGQEGTHIQAARDEHGARQMSRCANCEIEFFWSPTRVQGQVYCCTGCAAGGPCNCDYSLYGPLTLQNSIHSDQSC